MVCVLKSGHLSCGGQKQQNKSLPHSLAAKEDSVHHLNAGGSLMAKETNERLARILNFPMLIFVSV